MRHYADVPIPGRACPVELAIFHRSAPNKQVTPSLLKDQAATHVSNARPCLTSRATTYCYYHRDASTVKLGRLVLRLDRALAAPGIRNTLMAHASLPIPEGTYPIARGISLCRPGIFLRRRAPTSPVAYHPERQRVSSRGAIGLLGSVKRVVRAHVLARKSLTEIARVVNYEDNRAQPIAERRRLFQ
jgi:hypothetical protein